MAKEEKSVGRWDPFREFSALEAWSPFRDLPFARGLQEFFERERTALGRPAVDVTEDEKQYIVSATPAPRSQA